MESQPQIFVGYQLPAMFQALFNIKPSLKYRIFVEPLDIDDIYSEELSSTMNIKSNLNKIISNGHVWTDDDIKCVEEGRKIINQWKIFS